MHLDSNATLELVDSNALMNWRRPYEVEEQWWHSKDVKPEVPRDPVSLTPIVLLERLSPEEMDFHLRGRKADRREVVRGEDLLSNSQDATPGDDDDGLIPTELPCCYCAQPFICRTQLKHHERQHVAEEATDRRVIPIRCFICDKKYKNKYILQTHVGKVHADDRHRCRDCDKTFTRHALLAKHWKSTHGVAQADGDRKTAFQLRRVDKKSKTNFSSMYSCDECGNNWVFTDESELFAHVTQIHGINVDSVLAREEEEEQRRIEIDRRQDEEMQVRIACGKDCVVTKRKGQGTLGASERLTSRRSGQRQQQKNRPEITSNGQERLQTTEDVSSSEGPTNLKSETQDPNADFMHIWTEQSESPYCNPMVEPSTSFPAPERPTFSTIKGLLKDILSGSAYDEGSYSNDVV